MTFDPTQPTDTTKIRNLGIVIRPNWQAIENADSSFKPIALNLNNRTPLAPPNDPTAIADAFIEYCKDDTPGNAELFGIDADSNVIQMTQEGRIGSTNTDFTINEMHFASQTVDYSVNNIVHTYGRFDKDGNTIVAFNCSIARISTGIYEVTFDNALPGTLYVPVASPNDEGNTATLKIGNILTTSFRIFIFNENNNTRDKGGYFHVVGGF